MYKEKIDLIISHHPLVFYPINNVSTLNESSKKVVRLIQNNIALISLHLSLDIVSGGVNETLGSYFEGKRIEYIEKINETQGLGEIKELKDKTTFNELIKHAKSSFKYETVRWYGFDKEVKRIAYIGGAGSLSSADINLLKEKNVDVYITGEIKHHEILNLIDNGINLILLGHYNSEVVVLDSLKSMLSDILDENIEIIITKKLALN